MTMIPIFIPARNEEPHIGDALSRLPIEDVTVLANGCTDRTVEIARYFGARVIERPDAGKLPALQEAIADLGKYATGPFVTLDADSVPLFSRYWVPSLLSSLKDIDKQQPAVVVGPAVFVGGPGFAANTHRTVTHYKKQFTTRKLDFQGSFAGRNMLIRPGNNDVVDTLLELEHYWPGEDYAIRDTIVEHGGTTYKNPSPLAGVTTDAARYGNLRDTLSKTKQHALRSRLKQSYIDDRPFGARRYFKPTDPTYTFVDLTDMPTELDATHQPQLTSEE
ncbi:MAG: hypothetical protein JWM81_239 [Candidatus Saccharibacteria bacterium]|nr:hypothetical protein [Candidatus Saccharibacteria bacterium]